MAEAAEATRVALEADLKAAAAEDDRSEMARLVSFCCLNLTLCRDSEVLCTCQALVSRRSVRGRTVGCCSGTRGKA